MSFLDVVKDFSGWNDLRNFHEDPTDPKKALLAALALGSLTPMGFGRSFGRMGARDAFAKVDQRMAQIDPYYPDEGRAGDLAAQRFRPILEQTPRHYEKGMEPWEMLPDEFARRDDIVWHGSPTMPGLNQWTYGLHAGTFGAAVDRLNSTVGFTNKNRPEGRLLPMLMDTDESWVRSYPPRSSGLWTDPAANSLAHVVREVDPTEHLRVKFRDTDEVYQRERFKHIMNESASADSNYLDSDFRPQSLERDAVFGSDVIPYENTAEDVGSVSFLTFNPRAFKTHQELLVDAWKQGKDVSRGLKAYPRLSQRLAGHKGDRDTFDLLPPQRRPDSERFGPFERYGSSNRPGVRHGTSRHGLRERPRIIGSQRLQKKVMDNRWKHLQNLKRMRTEMIANGVETQADLVRYQKLGDEIERLEMEYDVLFRSNH